MAGAQLSNCRSGSFGGLDPIGLAAEGQAHTAQAIGILVDDDDGSRRSAGSRFRRRDRHGSQAQGSQQLANHGVPQGGKRCHSASIV